MPEHSFPVPRKPGSCICCGVPIVGTEMYRRIHFTLSDGTVAAVSTRAACEAQDWDAARISQLDAHCHAMWGQQSHPLQKKAWDHTTVTFLERNTDYPVQTWDELDALQVRF